MYIAPKQRQITPREHNFYVKWILLSLWPTDASLKEISLKCDFIHIFLYMLVALGQGQITFLGQFWCRMKPLVTVANWCKFRKQIWLNCDFLHVHNPGARADKPLGTEFWCRMKAFAMMANWWKFIIKISVNCDLVHFVFMITYLYIAQGHINPGDWIFMSN